jgi:hypothetical protein
MHVSSPKVPNAHAMQMHAQEETYLFIYLKGCEQDHGNRLRLKVRSNQDKDINTKNTLVLQHVLGQGVEGKNTSRRK